MSQKTGIFAGSVGLLGELARRFTGRTGSRASVPAIQALGPRSVSANHADETQLTRALTQSMYGRASNRYSLRNLLATVSRREDYQNGYYCGMLNRVSRDRVGSGPKLRTFFDDDTWNTAIQRRWQDWCVSVKLGTKLRCAVRDAARDGACLGVKFTRQANRSPVKLDVRFIDSLRLRPSQKHWFKDDWRLNDGIECDADGIPIRYWIAQENDFFSDPMPYDAKDVVHYFTAKSSEQYHGIPEATSALLLYPQLRRYTSAVIQAAEASACFVYFLKQTAYPNGNEPPIEPFEIIEIEPRTVQTLPPNVEMQSSTPQVPGAGHWEMIKAIIAEASRCFDLPLILAVGSAADANFSAANFDAIPYEVSTRLHRQDIEGDLVEPIFTDWYAEGLLIEDYFPARLRRKIADASEIPRSWGWDRTRQHADPLKEANAIATGLSACQRTLLDVYEERNLDARSSLEAEARLYGVSYDEFMAMALKKRFGATAPSGAPPEDDAADDAEENAAAAKEDG